MDTLETDKICRTCLGLSGPLLSIFDDSKSSIATMLHRLTRVKPKRDDNLPEKVCFTCISELNRCFTFVQKCENSNNTLRQLIVPNAIYEDSEDEITSRHIKVHCENKAIQTDEIKKPQLLTKTVQTNKLTSTKSQHIQTEDVVNEAHPEPKISSKKRKTAIPSSDAEEDAERQPTRKRIVKSSVVTKMDEESQQDDEQIQKTVISDVERIMLDLTKDEINTDNNSVVDVEHIIEDLTEMATETAEETCHYSGDSSAYYEIAQADEYLPTQSTTTIATKEDGDNIVMVCESENEDFFYDDCDQIVIEAKTMDSAQFQYTICKTESGDPELIMMSAGNSSSSGPDDEKTKRKSPQNTKFRPSSDINYICPKCKLTFISKKNMEKHIIRMHSDESSPINDATEAPVAEATDEVTETSVPAVEKEMNHIEYFCERCGAGFVKERSLKNHIRIKACTAQSFQCDECERVFATLENLDEHKAEKHSTLHRCTTCNHAFDSNEQLDQHMVLEHKRNLRNQCVVCKKVFTMLSALRDHMRVHSGEKPYTCDVCGRGFSQKQNLQQHKKRHFQEKTFKCNECDRSYVTKAELSSHSRVHTGEQPYKCEYCDASFTTSSSMMKHKRIHTGERPYGCDLCPLRFATLNVLKNHRRIHTGEKPFQCTFTGCKRSFAQRGDWLYHQKVHLNEKNFVCFCGQRFTSRALLRSHDKCHTMNKRQINTEQMKKMNANANANADLNSTTTLSSKRITRSKATLDSVDNSIFAADDKPNDSYTEEDVDEDDNKLEEEIETVIQEIDEDDSQLIEMKFILK